jgi:hypothetical protein
LSWLWASVAILGSQILISASHQSGNALFMSLLPTAKYGHIIFGGADDDIEYLADMENYSS